jgi:hypothetical protein
VTRREGELELLLQQDEENHDQVTNVLDFRWPAVLIEIFLEWNELQQEN